MSGQGRDFPRVRGSLLLTQAVSPTWATEAGILGTLSEAALNEFRKPSRSDMTELLEDVIKTAEDTCNKLEMQDSNY